MHGFQPTLTAQQSPRWTDYSLHHPSPHTAQFLSLQPGGPHLANPPKQNFPSSGACPPPTKSSKASKHQARSSGYLPSSLEGAKKAPTHKNLPPLRESSEETTRGKEARLRGDFLTKGEYATEERKQLPLWAILGQPGCPVVVQIPASRRLEKTFSPLENGGDGRHRTRVTEKKT